MHLSVHLAVSIFVPSVPPSTRALLLSAQDDLNDVRATLFAQLHIQNRGQRTRIHHS